MQAALNLNAQVSDLEPPTRAITQATIDRAKDMALTVDQMIRNAYTLIANANREVNVEHDSMTTLIKAKARQLVQIADLGISDVDELSKTMEKTINDKYNLRDDLQRDLEKYLLGLLKHYRHAVSRMMELRAIVCVECIAPPYRSSTEVTARAYRFLMRAKSVSHIYSATTVYRDLCDDYVKTYHIEANRQSVLHSVLVQMKALGSQLKKEHKILATATAAAHVRAIRSIHAASDFCNPFQSVFTSMTRLTSLSDFKNDLNVQYEKYKDELNAAVGRLLADWNTVSLHFSHFSWKFYCGFVRLFSGCCLYSLYSRLKPPEAETSCVSNGQC